MNFKDKLVAFDTETHLIQPGLLAPPLVCASAANSCSRDILDKVAARAEFTRILKDRIMVGAKISYDMLVMAVDAARRGIDLMPLIFKAYDEERVYDVQIAEALHALACGHLNIDPRTDAPLRSPSTGKPSRYSLEVVVDLVLGRINAKENDEWRLRYAELEGIPIDQWPENARQYPVDDAVNTFEVAMAQLTRNRNLHDLPRQVYADWALHLGAAWGFVTDKDAVDALEARVLGTRDEKRQPFIDGGILSPKEGGWKKNQGVIKRLVAKAYGATGQCSGCRGSGKDISKKTKKEINCKTCGATGFDLDSAPLPRTPTGGVSYGRDALSESGDDFLMSYASFCEEDKIVQTYVPFLRKGHNEDGSPRPLNLRPNVLIATGRSSYSDVVQLLPRSGGVRECIVARPGRVFYSCDYEGGELVTHGQNCLWTVGYSKLAEMLNAGVKVHDMLGAKFAGIDYEQFLTEKKTNPKLKDYRQAAKPVNFGCSGGMGAPTLVLQQRANGPDTTGPDGRKYKGLRFCILVGGEQTCGHTKITQWGRTILPGPVCKRCIEEATILRDAWFETFPENRDYFKWVAKKVDTEGSVIQHVSKRVRGNVEFCAAANSYFQGLLADPAKAALCRVAKEQYVVPSSPLYGSRGILFTHDELIGSSPEAMAPEAAYRVSEIMVEELQRYCPDLKVACKAEPALMRRMHKGAEAVFDENGRLIPWEPT